MLQRFPIAKSMCAVIVTWGFVLIGAGFCKSFIPMVVTRVLLGALEAPVAPGNFIIMTMWYTRREQPVRAGLFYTGKISTTRRENIGPREPYLAANREAAQAWPPLSPAS